ncbi:MAG: DUF3576 domain-containing protein [Candidatus Midichloriaceae bacterium]
MFYKNFRFIAVLVICSSLCACSKLNIKNDYPKTRQQKEEDRIGKLTGNGLTFGKGSSESSSVSSQMNINTYLWRASLDQVNFMPLNSTDSLSGAIVTDWYSVNDNSKERYKVNIYITGKELTAHSLKVSVYKRIIGSNGNWNNQYHDSNLAEKIKTKIIEKARELKVSESEVQ